MTAPSNSSAENNQEQPARDTFRWQALFQRASEPLFLLHHRCQILFVNRAWEDLTGRTAAEVRGLRCRRQRRAAVSDSWEEELARVLCPPPEVLHGRTARCHRLFSGDSYQGWWNIEFFPLLSKKGLLGILGKIVVAPQAPAAVLVPMPETLASLRERVAGRFRLENVTSHLPAMQRVVDQVRLASTIRTPVLLVGEAGSGKEWLARTLHYHGSGHERSFVSLDSERIPPELIESLLFGESRLILKKNVGTLYLREPALLPRDLQARFVEFLSSQRAQNPEELESHQVRIVAGCRQDPAIDRKSGRWLEELYWALSSLVISVPPLRERRSDLPELVEHLLERIWDESSRQAGHSQMLTSGAWEVIRAYPWPGNLRELFAVLLAAHERARGNPIEAAHFPAHVRLQIRLQHTPGRLPEQPLALDPILEQAERRLIQLALQRTAGNKSQAAELLSISRPRLLRRIEILGIQGTEAAKPSQSSLDQDNSDF